MLLDHKDAASISRIERGDRAPTLKTALGLQVLFDVPPRELFPGLYEAVEDAVMRRALKLHQELEGRRDQRSVAKREFLDALPGRKELNDIEL